MFCGISDLLFFFLHYFNETNDCNQVLKRQYSFINSLTKSKRTMKEVLYEVRCLKSTEDMILSLAGQFKQLSHEPVDFKHRTSYNTSFILHSFHGKT